MLDTRSKRRNEPPTGPKGGKRPADVNVRAAATDEIEDAFPDDGKNKAAEFLGR
jgi:hypothetical protein